LIALDRLSGAFERLGFVPLDVTLDEGD